MINTLEEDVITEKPWHLRGEISATNRPENSALEEQMDYNIGVRQSKIYMSCTLSISLWPRSSLG